MSSMATLGRSKPARLCASRLKTTRGVCAGRGDKLCVTPHFVSFTVLTMNSRATRRRTRPPPAIKRRLQRHRQRAAPVTPTTASVQRCSRV